MFKGRLKIWALTLVICLIAELLYHYIPIWFTKETVSVQVTTEDEQLAEEINDGYMRRFEMQVKKSDTEIIISSADDEISGYTLHKNQMYSPIVLYGRSCMGSNKSGFIAKTNESNCFKVSLRNILIAIEEEKQWEDLGFDDSVVSGKVTLCIPCNSAWYYSQIEELFYLTLNDGKPLDDDTTAKLKPRVDNIISKCNQVDDVLQYIRNDYDEKFDDGTLCVGPEFLTKRSDSSIGTNSSYSYIPVYLDKTTYVTLNMYTKDEDELASRFFERITNNNDFMDITGYRMSDSNISFSSSYLQDYIPEP